MNERIKELALQAGFGEQWFEEHPTGCSLPKPLMLKEYTELIVRDCALTAGLMEHEGRTGIGAQLLDNYGIT